MRIFSDPVEAIKEIERDLYEMGTRYQSATVQDQDVSENPEYQTIELCGYAYMITDFTERRLKEMVLYTEYVPWEWVEEEIRERLFGTPPGFDLNPGKAWGKNEKLWGRFIRNGVFSYSYAERWQEQLPYVIRELKHFPNTRQAIITMYDRHQDMLNWGGFDRVPCSLTYQFLLREDKLVLIYNQRSCDFVKFFGADVYFGVQLLKYIAGILNKEPGQFIHFLGSIHAFAGDLKGKEIF